MRPARGGDAGAYGLVAVSAVGSTGCIRPPLALRGSSQAVSGNRIAHTCPVRGRRPWHADPRVGPAFMQDTAGGDQGQRPHTSSDLRELTPVRTLHPRVGPPA